MNFFPFSDKKFLLFITCCDIISEHYARKAVRRRSVR